ncbi:MAG: hypothetical protein AABY22_07155 [Nanoarchaeota archaeon]
MQRIKGIRVKDITNRNFGRWKVISFSHTKRLGEYGYQMWNCICECGTKKVVEGKSLRQGTSFSCGCFVKERIPRGENHYHWKGDKIGYEALHKWLRRIYGNANKCENPDCKSIVKTYEYALLKRKKYERKRENFWQLCRSCHRKYDYTEETRKKHQNQIPWNKGIKTKKVVEMKNPLPK